jgi:putative transcriptional regulator
MTVSHAGRLLVATPLLVDPNFDLSVMLLLEHGDDGALGVILNRPSELAVADALPDWADACAEPQVLFAGGPVERDALIALGRPSTTEAGGLVLGLHSVDLDAQPALVLAGGVADTRIFAGYAGWSPGQLDDELSDEAWWLVEADVDDVFTADPPGLWSRVLRRAGGELSLFAHYPADLSRN